jgi:SPP1 gp7 family putative phage head morphogenesis protein
VTSGWSVSSLAQEILAMDSKISQGRANFIARDQIGKLNGHISQRRMESAGLSMYEWMTSGDERVRESHWIMDGLLCRWDDPTVYSDDGGKTWKDRPSGAVLLHPGDDFQCRCTSLAYWQEIVGEVDEQIDLLSGSVDNIPDSGQEGLAVMNPPSARTKNEVLKQQQKAQEQRRRQENAKKAKQFADEKFPGEKWKKVEDGIYLSPRRPVGKKSNYGDEKKDAEILRSLGSTVYLTPEVRSMQGRKYDAIVNGEEMEFKNMRGKSPDTLIDHFYSSRGQAPNVFINLEHSPLTKQKVINILYGARNSPKYAEKNDFPGGKIILKIKGRKNLVYLNVDDLKIGKKQ